MSLLDPRSGCTDCLPYTSWADYPAHWAENPKLQCEFNGQCRKSKAAAMGVEEPNAACLVDSFHFGVTWCDSTSPNDNEVAELTDPSMCTAKRGDVVCSGHGTCISESYGVTDVVHPALPTMSVDSGCVAILSEEGRLGLQPYGGGSCGPLEGIRDADSVLGADVAGGAKFKMVGICGDYILVGLTDGRLFTLPRTGSGYRSFTRPVMYSHADDGNIPLKWISCYYECYVLIDNTAYYVNIWNSPSMAFLDFMMSVPTNGNDVATRLHVSDHVMTMATEAGNWYMRRVASTSCIFFGDECGMIPASAFQKAGGAIMVAFEIYAGYALTPSGAILRWPFPASNWTSTVWTEEATIEPMRSPFLTDSAWHARITTDAVNYNTGGGRIDSFSVSPISQMPWGSAVSNIAELGSANSVVWVLLKSGAIGILKDGSWTTMNVYATFYINPLGVHDVDRRFYTESGGGDELEEDVFQHVGDVLGPSQLIQHPDADSGIFTGETCVCNKGWTGLFCAVPRDCDDVVEPYGCVSGTLPWQNIHRDLVLLPRTQNSQFATDAIRREVVEPLATPPSIATRTRATRYFVVRQRYVQLDTNAVIPLVTGVEVAHSRFYVPPVAEYICYRAGGGFGRVMHENDIATMSRADSDAIRAEIDAGRGTTAGTSSDGMFWVRKARSLEDGIENRGWDYAAFDVSWSHVRTYHDSVPTKVANVVCAFDNFRAGSVDMEPDIFASCKLPAFFCELYRSSSGNQFCSWIA